MKINWKGPLLGAVIFVVSLFLAVYQRWSHGLRTRFSDILTFWLDLIVYLGICLVAGSLIYILASFVRHRLFGSRT
jgi:hypothetical protein